MKPIPDELRELLASAPQWKTIDSPPPVGREVLLGFMDGGRVCACGIGRLVDEKMLHVETFESWWDRWIDSGSSRQITHYLDLDKAAAA